jgi:maltooligosyltrehalose synthase
VDWTAREEALDAISGALGRGTIDARRLAEWRDHPEDDCIKLYITGQLLHLRRNNAAIMSHGSYEPLTCTGALGDRVFGFGRVHGDDSRLVVVPRLTGIFGTQLPVGGAWGDTLLALPGAETGRAWRCELGGQVVQSRNGSLMLADVLAILPMAVLAPA